MKTNIVIDGLIFESQKYGGISRIYHEIVPRMGQIDESMQFFMLTAGQLEQALPQSTQIQHQSLNFRERHLRPGKYFWLARWRGRCRAQANWLQNNRADIWHSTYYTLPSRWQGPVVITAYDLIYALYPHIFRKRQDAWTRTQIRKAVIAADVVVCISETTRADLLNIYSVDPSKVIVIPLGVGSVFRRMQAADPVHIGRRPFLLYVGSRGAYKNFSSLLLAYSRWSHRHEIDLLVVGSPWTKQELQLLQKLEVAGNVLLETAITDQELALLYNQAAAFVYPSLYEGFGLPLLEAMACGCPVVASNIPASVEVARDLAYYFEPGSAEELLAALDRAVNDGRFSPRVQRGLRLAADFSWENTARQTLEIYHALA